MSRISVVAVTSAAWKLAVVGIAISLPASISQAQNMLGDNTFETYNFTTPWRVVAGSPTLYSNFIWNMPTCPNVLGLRFSPSLGLDEVEQTRTMPFEDKQMYLAYADLAGDRPMRVEPWTASLRVVVDPSAPYATNMYADVPPAAVDLVQNATWRSRVRRIPVSIPRNSSFRFNLRDDDDAGVLIDQVHLFPIYWNDCICPNATVLAGFSVNDDYSSSDTWPNPIKSLYKGTPGGCCPVDACAGGPDQNGVWLWNEPCSMKGQMMIAAWTFNDQNGPQQPTTLSMELEIESFQGTPGFVVQFYDWKLQRWVGAPGIAIGGGKGNLGKPFPGGTVKAGPKCFTVNWAQYFCPLPNNPKLSTPLGNYVSNPAPTADGNFSVPGHPQANLVLARVTFGVTPEWTLTVGGFPPPPPPTWIIKVHHAAISCN